MTEKRILFGKFEFPVEKGLEYLVNENIPETDFICINEPHDTFSMIIEKASCGSLMQRKSVSGIFSLTRYSRPFSTGNSNLPNRMRFSVTFHHLRFD